MGHRGSCSCQQLLHFPSPLTVVCLRLEFNALPLHIFKTCSLTAAHVFLWCHLTLTRQSCSETHREFLRTKIHSITGDVEVVSLLSWSVNQVTHKLMRGCDVTAAEIQSNETGRIRLFCFSGRLHPFVETI